MDREERNKEFHRLGEFYYANKERIDTNHEGQYCLLYRMDLIGYFPNKEKAQIHALSSHFEEGLYLIHKCDLSEEPVTLINEEVLQIWK